MKSGFYKLNKLSKETLVNFFKDAIFLSYDTHVEIKENAYREIYSGKSIADMLDMISLENHNVCIDRSIQHPSESYGEVGFCTMKGPQDLFLYIFLTLENLQKLIISYGLKDQYE